MRERVLLHPGAVRAPWTGELDPDQLVSRSRFVKGTGVIRAPRDEPGFGSGCGIAIRGPNGNLRASQEQKNKRHTGAEPARTRSVKLHRASPSIVSDYVL